MTDTENVPSDKKSRAKKVQVEEASAASTPATAVTQAPRGVGPGMVAGIAAATLVGGLGIGGVAGFALSAATHERPQLVSQSGPMTGQPSSPEWQQSGPGQGHGMPGLPPQGGQAPQGGGTQPHDQQQDDGSTNDG